MVDRYLLCLIMSCCCVRLMAVDPGVPRNCTITGSMLDDVGEPVQGHIMGYRLTVRQGRIAPEVECSTRADSDGNFQCQHLRPGAYAIVVNTLRRLPGTGSRQTNNNSSGSMPLFVSYPEGNNLESDALVHLAAGETQSVEIEVSTDFVSELRVESVGGTAKDKVLQVFLQGKDFAIPANVRIEANPPDANYTVRLIPAGTYRLSENWSIDGVRRQAVASVTVGQLSSGDASLVEEKRFSLSGSVQYADSPATMPPEVLLRSAAENDSHRYVASVTKDGSFTFKDIFSGRYYLSFNPGDGLYVSDILAGGRSLQDVPIAVDEGISRLLVTVVVKGAAASISGSLELDGSERDPGVLIQSLESHTSQIVPVDIHGSFSVRGLAPGEYLLYGWADTMNVPYESPHFLRRFADKALHVDLDNGSVVTNLQIDCNKAAL